MRKICVVIGSRANYASSKSLLAAIDAHKELELQLVVMASALLDRFGSVIDVIRNDGFTVADKVFCHLEGETLSTMAQSVGLALVQMPTVFLRLKPDVVLTIGDRFETIATAISASYMNIPLAHTMGGEQSGTIDESVRHAITKLAHIHFPATKEAGFRIVRMGESSESVYPVGCPRIDLAKEIKSNGQPKGCAEYFAKEGVGSKIDIDNPFLLVAQYPVTTEYEEARKQMNETLVAVQMLSIPTLILWPNADAGSEEIASSLRTFREKNAHLAVRFVKNFPPEYFLYLMNKTACMLGNSSSAIREGAYFGTPAVNIGSRQRNRERAENVIDSEPKCELIVQAVKKQLAHGKYASSSHFGDGTSGCSIASILAKCPLSVQKRLSY